LIRLQREDGSYDNSKAYHRHFVSEPGG
jgi:hypothetical protein